jgi:hypothetical protein
VKWSIILALFVAMACPGEGLATDHVILIVRRPPNPDPVQVQPLPSAPPAPPAAAAAQPTSLEEVYSSFWNHPNQIYIDSPSGPKPLLGMDIIQEGGRIYPRIPDPYTYRIMKNPDDYEAYVEYLDWRKAVIRRTRIAMGRVPEIAYDEGIITPEVLAVPKSYDAGPGYVAVHNVRALDEGHLGTPFVEPKEARELGMLPEEVPVFPDAAADVEIYLFWHPRCEHCHTMMRDWFAFAEPVAEAGYKVMGIISARRPEDVDTNEVVGAIEAMVVRFGDQVRAVKNMRDRTGLIQAMNISGTPTVLFVNRVTQQVIRRVGPQDLQTMQADFWAISGTEEVWPPKNLDGEPELLPQIQGQTPLGGATP